MLLSRFFHTPRVRLFHRARTRHAWISRARRLRAERLELRELLAVVSINDISVPVGTPSVAVPILIAPSTPGETIGAMNISFAAGDADDNIPILGTGAEFSGSIWTQPGQDFFHVASTPSTHFVLSAVTVFNPLQIPAGPGTAITYTLNTAGLPAGQYLLNPNFEFMGASTTADTALTFDSGILEIQGSGPPPDPNTNPQILFAVGGNPPTTTPATVSIMEDMMHTFSTASGNQVIVQDDSGAAQFPQSIQARFRVQHGTLQALAPAGAILGGQGTSTLTITGTAAAIQSTLNGGLKYTPDANYNATRDPGGPAFDVSPMDPNFTGPPPTAGPFAAYDPSTQTPADAGDRLIVEVNDFGQPHGPDHNPFQMLPNDVDPWDVRRFVPIAIMPKNDAPFLHTQFPPVQLAENGPTHSVNLGTGGFQNGMPFNLLGANFFDDADKFDRFPDNLTITIQNSNPALVNIGPLHPDGQTLNGSVLNITPQPNQTGTAMITVTATDLSGAAAQGTFMVTITPFQEQSFVQDVQLFYNNSAFDGNGPAVGAADFNAIATDKDPLLVGGLATAANISPYGRGINGLFIDVSALPNDGAGINAADFTFRVGNTNNPATWAFAPVPASVGVLPNAAPGGADRIFITWADRAIVNTWLGVTMDANADTNLSQDESFFYASVPGETGASFANLPPGVHVDAADMQSMGQDLTPLALFGTEPVTNDNDADKDGSVTAFDIQVAGQNLGFDKINLIAPTLAAAVPQVVAAPTELAPVERIKKPLYRLASPAPNVSAQDQRTRPARVQRHPDFVWASFAESRTGRVDAELINRLAVDTALLRL